ncbi:hypothetical protein HELRODRAFT_176249 [Helobdella robusta]|uniref:RUN domain-containing protein n=1 Tax=Helobdella robusta TaxID=6412 RepID=T1FAC1_HELRO|nr:hypothetical protein HELRODRAFT_176249 [Helobdella robusta]ESN99951.1 hypothetical protein HELRODRAFT_176249 [Helobdella robusta]
MTTDPLELEVAPSEFLISPNLSPSSSLSSSDVDDAASLTQSLNYDMLLKKDLALEIIKSVNLILKYINSSSDHLEKLKRCSTRSDQKIGALLLDHLCPSIHALMLDGVKHTVPSLFGRVKSSACKIFEDSVDGGQSLEVLANLPKLMKDLKFLNSQWLKFNSYLFALLNLKLLDVWLCSLLQNKFLVHRYYNPSAFLHLVAFADGYNGNNNNNNNNINNNNNNSNNSQVKINDPLRLSGSCNLATNINDDVINSKFNSGKRASVEMACSSLFSEVMTSLQNLSHYQFCLEYDYEVRVIERRRQNFIAEQLLNKHVAMSNDATTDTTNYHGNHHYHSHQHRVRMGTLKHTSSLDSTNHVVSSSLHIHNNTHNNAYGNYILKNPTHSLCLDGKYRRNLESLDENSSLFWSSASFESFTKNFLQKTQNKLAEKLYSGGKSVMSPDGSLYRLMQHFGISINSCEKSTQTVDDQFQQQQQQHQQDSQQHFHSQLYNPVDTSTRMTQRQLHALTPSPPSPSNKNNVNNNNINNNNNIINNNSNTSSSTPIIRMSSSSSSSSSSASLSSYGHKLVNLFDKLLLSNAGRVEDKMDECAPKQFHSQEQINVDRCNQSLQRSNVLASSVSVQGKGGSNMAAHTLCHYVAMDKQFLSFEKDLPLLVVKDVGHDLYLCRHAGQEGLVYKACIRLL